MTKDHSIIEEELEEVGGTKVDPVRLKVEEKKELLRGLQKRILGRLKSQKPVSSLLKSFTDGMNGLVDKNKNFLAPDEIFDLEENLKETRSAVYKQRKSRTCATVPGPSSQGGLGEEGTLVGTTTPSGPSPPRGSGVPVRKPKNKELSNKKTDLIQEKKVLDLPTVPTNEPESQEPTDFRDIEIETRLEELKNFNAFNLLSDGGVFDSPSKALDPGSLSIDKIKEPPEEIYVPAQPTFSTKEDHEDFNSWYYEKVDAKFAKFPDPQKVQSFQCFSHNHSNF